MPMKAVSNYFAATSVYGDVGKAERRLVDNTAAGTYLLLLVASQTAAHNIFDTFAENWGLIAIACIAYCFAMPGYRRAQGQILLRANFPPSSAFMALH